MHPSYLNEASLQELPDLAELIAYRELRENGFAFEDFVQADIAAAVEEREAEINALAGILHAQADMNTTRVDDLAGRMQALHITDAADNAVEELQSHVDSCREINAVGQQRLRDSYADLQQQKQACQELEKTLKAVRRKAATLTPDRLGILPSLHEGGCKLSDTISKRTRDK